MLCIASARVITFDTLSHQSLIEDHSRDKEIVYAYLSVATDFFKLSQVADKNKEIYTKVRKANFKKLNSNLIPSNISPLRLWFK